MRLNQLKIIAAAELRVATKVDFILLDLRLTKKPKLTEIWPKPKKAIPGYQHNIIEVSHKNPIKLADISHILDRHIVLVVSEGPDSLYPSKEAENTLLKKVLDLLRKQSWVSLLKDGAKELFRSH